MRDFLNTKNLFFWALIACLLTPAAAVIIHKALYEGDCERLGHEIGVRTFYNFPSCRFVFQSVDTGRWVWVDVQKFSVERARP